MLKERKKAEKLRWKSLWSWVVCLFLCLTAVPMNIQAAERIHTDQDVSLTVHYETEEGAARGAELRLYRIADVTAGGRYTPTNDFKKYKVNWNELNSGSWKNLAAVLIGYADRDGIEPSDRGNIDQDGKVHFPSAGETWKPGLYLAAGSLYQGNFYTYTASPFIISLPLLNEDDTWNYEPEVDVKYERHSSTETTITRKVLKVWENTSGDHHPSEVEIQLLQDGSIFDTVSLNGDNEWRYTWNGLESGHIWQVVEKSVPAGYTVEVRQEGITFVVTNTRKGGNTPGGNTPGGNTPGGDTPDNPPGTTVTPPDEPNPGEPVLTVIETPEIPLTPILPQTGVLWWPVSVLAGCGAVSLMIGFLTDRRRGGEGNGKANREKRQQR